MVYALLLQSLLSQELEQAGLRKSTFVKMGEIFLVSRY